MPGIFITSQSPKGQRITGHYLSKHGGQWRVHVFTNCTPAFVIREASAVIHCPPIFHLQPQPQPE